MTSFLKGYSTQMLGDFRLSYLHSNIYIIPFSVSTTDWLLALKIDYSCCVLFLRIFTCDKQLIDFYTREANSYDTFKRFLSCLFPSH